VITGLNNEAVHKAAQAMSFESRFPGMAGQFALVREVRPLPEIPPERQSTDLTFADLGYDDKVLKSFSQKTNYYFYIPFGWRLTDGAILDLHFSHSQLLDYSNSFLNVLLNDSPMATIALDDETSLRGELKVELSPSQARPGQSNRISIQAEMYPIDICSDMDMWLLVSDESMLHLNHQEQDAPSLDLDFYPYPFDQRPDLADVIFILPPEPEPGEWEDVLQLAATLGDAAGGSNLAPAVTLGSNWSDEALAGYHLIAMGRPSRNLMIQQVNPQLPQPFQLGSDAIEQRLNNVIFRMPSDLSLGIVQFVPSPWNEARILLVVTGTTDPSVREATSLLVNQPWALKGNLVLVRDGAINTLDTRELTGSGIIAAVATAVPGIAEVATVSPTPTPAPTAPTAVVLAEQPVPDGADSPAWLVLLVGTTGVAVTAIFVIAFWQARQRKRNLSGMG
ncbi:MAG: hypothetical protein DRJ03_19975, partial [Chloroflexi bacterium]